MNEPGKNPEMPISSRGQVQPIVNAQRASIDTDKIVDAEMVKTDADGKVDDPNEVETVPSAITPPPVFEPEKQSNIETHLVEIPPILSRPAILESATSPRETVQIAASDSIESSRGESAAQSVQQKSWVFRFAGGIANFSSHLFGIASIIFLLAVAASIPFVQLLSFGYLLEVSGRLARQQSFRDAMIGLHKASRLGSIVLGSWITLLPIRFLSALWHEAYLIDSTSTQTQAMQIVLIVFIALAILHIAAALVCGGKLRYFFWPIVAPFSFVVWIVRRTAGSTVFRKLLSNTIGRLSPNLVDDICNAHPISDWFLPAIFLKRVFAKNIYQRLRDAVWEFTISLNLSHYFQLGLKGMIGSFAWLLVPTILLVIASYAEGGVAIISGLFGVLFAIPIFMTLPFLQAHFAKDGELKRFIELRSVFKNFGRAPVAHLFALLLTLALALPLFFLKIEEIPHELLWTLSFVFIMFSWPARMSLGWAYRRGAKRTRPSRWWIRYPAFLLAGPIALAFALILTLTRYTSWYGALSLFENHVFLLPAPFWL